MSESVERKVATALNIKDVPTDDELAGLIHRLKVAADRRYADRQLLLWLHAEAVHKLTLCGAVDWEFCDDIAVAAKEGR